jgi:beta-galactosidase/beta-glucuronidase
MKIVSLKFEVIRATPAVAEFTVRVEHNGLVRTGEFAGRAMGPRCEGISTLEVAYPLTTQETNDEAVTLRCSIPEPNLWTRESPFAYEVFIELRLNGEMVESRSRTIAFRNR